MSQKGVAAVLRGKVHLWYDLAGKYFSIDLIDKGLPRQNMLGDNIVSYGGYGA